MDTKKTQGPATLNAYLAMGIALVIVIVGFVLLLRHDLQAVRPCKPESYTEPAPADTVYSLQVSYANGCYTVDGYVFVPGQPPETVDNPIALYSAQDGSCLQLSTALVHRQDAADAGGSPGFSRSGFSAFVRQEDLPLNPQAYEICVLYRTNKHNFILHTGILLQEVPA